MMKLTEKVEGKEIHEDSLESGSHFSEPRTPLPHVCFDCWLTPSFSIRYFVLGFYFFQKSPNVANIAMVYQAVP